MPPFLRFFHDVRTLPRDLRLMALVLFIWASGEALFFNIVPLYLEQLGATPVQIGNILSIASLFAAATMIPAGLLTDRWGAKRVLLLGWITGLLAGIFMALAPNLYWFSLGWVAYAVTLFVIPAVSAYSVKARGPLPPERALTMTSAAFALGSVLSPLLAGFIVERFGLRSLFVVATGCFLASTLVVRFVRANDEPAASAPAPRANFRALLNDRRFVGLGLLTLLVWSVMQVGVPLAPNFLADMRGFSVSRVATLGTFYALGWMGLNLVLGRIAPRRGFLVVQGLVMVYLVLLLRTGATAWIALAYVLRAAHLTGHALVNAQATRFIDRSRWGLAFGMLETLAWLGAFVGPLIAGRLYDRDPALPFQVSLVLLPVTLLLSYLFLPRPEPEAAPVIVAGRASESELIP